MELGGRMAKYWLPWLVGRFWAYSTIATDEVELVTWSIVVIVLLLWQYYMIVVCTVVDNMDRVGECVISTPGKVKWGNQDQFFWMPESAKSFLPIPSGVLAQ